MSACRVFRVDRSRRVPRLRRVSQPFINEQIFKPGSNGKIRCKFCGNKAHAWSGSYDYSDWRSVRVRAIAAVVVEAPPKKKSLPLESQFDCLPPSLRVEGSPGLRRLPPSANRFRKA